MCVDALLQIRNEILGNIVVNVYVLLCSSPNVVRLLNYNEHYKKIPLEHCNIKKFHILRFVCMHI